MNCIFCCVFHETLDIFYLFLESLFIYGNLNDNTDIVVYTTTQHMEMIKKSNLFVNSRIIFEINDDTNGKIDLFKLKSISDYDKIFYLNIDILFTGDINKIFDSCNENNLYALEEINKDENNESVIRTEILLFSKNFQGYDNQVLSQFFNGSGKIIHRFSSVYENKLQSMTNFLNCIKEFTIKHNITKTKQYIDDYLLPIIKNTGELLEGNIFMTHNTTNYTNIFLNKAKNISNLVLNKNIKNVMEIGFNAGFSTLLMLFSNPNINITCFDLGEHKYTLLCYQKLKETFGDRLNIIIGDSMETLPKHNATYDLIHIDGGHGNIVANSDIVNSYRLSKQGTVLIMDDYDFLNLHKIWDFYIFLYNLQPLNINIYNSPHHDIKTVVK